MNYWTQEDFIHTAENTNLGAVHEELLTTWAEEHPDWQINVQIQTNLEQFKTPNSSRPTRAGMRRRCPSVTRSGYPSSTEISRRSTRLWRSTTTGTRSWRMSRRTTAFRRAVWQNTDCRALYYRQDLIDEYADGEPPRTWDKLVSVGQDIVDNEDMNAYMYNGGRWEATTFDNLAHFWALGGTLVNDEGAPVLDQEENRQALIDVMARFRRTIDSGITPSESPTSTTTRSCARPRSTIRLRCSSAGTGRSAR